MNSNGTKHTPGPWIIRQPGTHGKELRVCKSHGVAVSGVEICAAVAMLATTRSSAGPTAAKK